MSALLENDGALRASLGVTRLCGADEAGRGPLAGPVVAAAVILPEDCRLEGLDDSKKLTPRRREALFPEICRRAVAWGVCQVGPEEIDQINILNASLVAMRRAWDQLEIRPEFTLLDGNTVRYFDGIPVRAVVKGDGRHACIAAASILAKVVRDREMARLDAIYPGYGLGKHKGYPTKAHYEALRKLGPTPIHRKSFLKNL